jgi:hypothetical protein
MSNNRFFILLLSGILMLSGCITVEEHYTFKKNGSGSMEYVVDMSALAEMMEAFEDMGSGEDGGESTDDKLELVKDLDELESLDGISKVHLTDEKLVSRVSFRFDGIESLNKALNVLMPDSTGAEHTFFTMDGHTIKRIHNNRSELGNDMADKDEEVDSTEMLRSMKYRIFVKGSPAVQVSGYGDEVAVTRESKKQVTMEADFKMLDENPSALNVQFDLSK